MEEELLSEESSPQIRSEEGFVGETWIGLCQPKERKIRFFVLLHLSNDHEVRLPASLAFGTPVDIAIGLGT